MSQPLFPSVDGEGKIREEHLPERLSEESLEILASSGSSVDFTETATNSGLWEFTKDGGK